MKQLQDKVAIVTGGGSGIGKGIASAFATEGCAVVIASRNAVRLRATVKALAQSGSEIVSISTDVTDEAQVQALFEQTVDRFGHLDILVNSSGAFDGGPIDTIPLEAWDKVIGANLTGPFLCIREAFKIMKAAGGGRIINIGSISAQRTRENMAPYTASKFGIWGLTQAAALEGRPYGIAVSCLHPGNTAVERRTQSGKEMDQEPMIATGEMARVALLMATLPPEVNILEAIVLPVNQLYIGRG
ncbi:MAG: SDR family oxidoreductase [Anaerolineae bacterium]|nr:SDR family oxidoreductase [Anaerolineae bacterium]